MADKEYRAIYVTSILLFVIFLIYNLWRKSQWALDNTFTLVFLLVIYWFNEKLNLRKIDVLLLNLSLLVHNFGMFAFYSWNWHVIEDDNLIHFIAGFSGGYIIFYLVEQQLRKIDHQKTSLVIERHKILVAFLVIALVTTLGVGIELMEFAGSELFGPGEGLFFYGAGDVGKFGNPAEMYGDTMSDIIINIVAAIIGAITYAFCHLRKKPQ